MHAEVSARIDPRGGSEGHEDIPVYPHDFEYTVSLVSDASPDAIARVAAAVEKACPILNLLKRGTNVTGRIDHKSSASVAAA
ncbi:OsmC-like protein [compost metagenome]